LAILADQIDERVDGEIWLSVSVSRVDETVVEGCLNIRQPCFERVTGEKHNIVVSQVDAIVKDNT
jgi:hypothetical protein